MDRRIQAFVNMFGGFIDEKMDGQLQSALEPTPTDTIWREYAISTEPQYFIAGPLRLWYKSISKELWVAFDRKGEEVPASAPPPASVSLPEGQEEQESVPPPKEEAPTIVPPPEGIVWSRWVLEENIDTIRLRPVFADRPIIIKPEHTLRVAKKAKLMIYVRIPLWLRIEVKKAKSPIMEVPIVVLSKTYFGTYMQGEQCYWISSGVRGQFAPDPARPFLAICPLKIVNSSEEELYIGKICLRVAELSLYLAQGQLWANQTKITYRGSNNISQIDIDKKIPDEIGQKAVLLTSPRNSERKKGFAAKTFETLKDLPGLGFLLKYGE